MSALIHQIDTPRLSGTLTNGNLLSATADNGIQDSGSKPADFATAAQGLLAEGALPRTGARYVVVAEAATDLLRGTASKAAYATAKTMTPTAASQVFVVHPPGVYDYGATGITLDTEYINLVALVPAKVANAGTAAMILEPTVKLTADTGATSGTVIQTANNVLISDVEIANTSDENPYNYADTDPAAYFPNTGVTGTVLRRVKIEGDTTDAGDAWATRLVAAYAQPWQECIVTGTYSVNSGGSGTMSGTISNSTITGDSSVGGSGGTMSGTISGSTITGNSCVGGGGTMSGTISDSTITGDYCVGGSGGTIAATARLYNVTVSGTDAMNANIVNAAAEFHNVTGLPFDDEGKIYNSITTAGVFIIEGGA